MSEDIVAAASARLCVETIRLSAVIVTGAAAASARLCVETPHNTIFALDRRAAASARLCVETLSLERQT